MCWYSSAIYLDVIAMSLLDFRTLCAELKNVPCESDTISNKKLKYNDLANLLSTAMKALSEAETVIAKQADAILQSTHEISLYLREKHTAFNSLPIDMGISTPNDSAPVFLPLLKVEGNESSNTKPRSYASAVKTDSTKEYENLCCDRSTESNDVFRDVKARTHKKKRRTSNIATGCKRGIILGSCYRKMDVFLSRMGPDVSAEQVEDFCKSMLDDWCEVEMLNSKFPALYSSFRITCYSHQKNKRLW